MKVLYVDNLRGFTKQYIPICDVNFFVGENSSGKSSILSILKIFNDQQFWLHYKFNLDDIDLGNFDDLVSGESKNKSSFTLALTRQDTTESRQKKPAKDEKPNLSKAVFCLALTFKALANEPILSKISFIKDGTITHARISAGVIYINTKPISQTADWDLNKFKKFIQEHQESNLKYVKHFLPKEVRVDAGAHVLPLFFLVSIIEQLAEKKTYQSRIQLPITDDITWLAPIREKPRRSYDNIKKGYSPEGNHIPALLDEILNSKDHNKKHGLQKVLREFGTASGLFTEISSKRYGRGNAPFELGVTLNKKAFRISNVGYGISQVLPIIVESFISRPNTVLAVQQPEVHLHPRAQAALGAFFYEIAASEQKKFLVETHSDFLIDRFRVTRKKNQNSKISAQVLFFTRGETGNKCVPIQILEDGSYDSNQPKAFKEFFINENLMILGLD